MEQLVKTSEGQLVYLDYFSIAHRKPLMMDKDGCGITTTREGLVWM